MTIVEYNNYKKLIKAYFKDGESLADRLADYKGERESNGTTYGAALLMVQWGEFAAYYPVAIEELAEIYGSEFDRTKYETENGTLRFKNGECYAWTIYKHKIAKTIETMEKKGEL